VVDIGQLAQDITVGIAPFLPFLLGAGQKIEEEAGKELGAEAWDNAQALWGTLQPKVEAKPAAQEAALDVANDPQDDDAQAALRLQLKKLLVEDPNLAENVDRLWQQAAMLQPPGSVSVSGNRNVVVGGAVKRSKINTGDRPTKQ